MAAHAPTAKDWTGANDDEGPTSSFWIVVVLALVVVVAFHDQCVPLSNLAIVTDGEGAF